VQALGQVGLPVVPRIGAALALEGGHGRRALPTRPAALGAVVGVVGVVGALTLATGITDAVTNAGRFGTTWDVEVEPAGEDAAPVRAAAEVMTGDDDYEAVGVATQGYLTLGEVVLPTFSIEALSGTMDFTVYEGRAPANAGEIALGPAIASSQGIEIGDTVALGDGERVEMVGLALVPQTPHSSFDQGAWLHPDGAERLFEQSYPNAYGRLREGVDPQDEVAELAETAGPEVTVITPDPPADQLNLRGVRTLPTLFAIFTVVLALGALAHVSVSVLRRRRGELAVLRSVGLTPRQTWWCLSCQASTLAVIGLVIGVPIGVALGRNAWRSVADATPLIYVPPTAALALVLAVPVAVLLANVVAALPGLRAARLKPAEVLRSE
jgi:hypothetical protein